MKAMLLIAALMLTNNKEDALVGRWISKPSSKGNVTELVFKPDNVIEGYTNKKLFATGKYFFNSADSIITFVDNGCDNLTAVYKVQLFSDSDSLYFSIVMDSCFERRKGIQRLVLGRKKQM